MSYLTREAVMVALQAIVGNSSNYQTVSRRLQHWDQMINSAALPALFLYQKPENHKRGQDMITIRTLNVELWIYANSGLSSVVIPSTELNALVDAIDPMSGGVLVPDLPQQNRMTLGGIVYDCWIEGELLMAPSDLENGISVAMIPLKITLP